MIFDIVGSTFARLSDEVNQQLKQLESWTNDTLSQDPEKSSTKEKRCEICLSKEDPNDLELHHLAGRKHDYKTITVCKKCHYILSQRQTLWPRIWLLENLPKRKREGLLLLGLYEALILKSEKTSDSLFKQYAQKLTNDISRLLSDP